MSFRTWSVFLHSVDIYCNKNVDLKFDAHDGT